ncbi:hypothetical protein [Streptomyces sp. YS-3]
MKSTLNKLVTMSVMTLVVTSAAAIPAQAAPEPPDPGAGAVCETSGIVG